MKSVIFKNDSFYVNWGFVFMNFKKMLFSFVFMVIGLQASEVNVKRDFFKILNSASSDYGITCGLNFDALKNLELILTQHPKIAQEPNVLKMAIDRGVGHRLVKLLLQNGAVPDAQVMQQIMLHLNHLSKVVTVMEVNKRLKPVLKVLMQYGGKIDPDMEILVSEHVAGSSRLRYRKISALNRFSPLINKIKAEIEEEDEARALAAFMTEAGLRTKSGNKNISMSDAVFKMLGNSEESLGCSAELKK